MRIIFRFAPAIFFSALIFILSSISGLKASDTYEVDLLSRKSAHVVIYFLLTISYMWALIPSASFKKLAKLSNFQYFLGFILSTLYAISDEIHQSFVTNRTGKVTDVLIDLVAISLAIFVFKRKMVLK